MNTAELVRLLQDRESEIMPRLEELRKAYPSIRDDQRLAWMYLELKDQQEKERKELGVPRIGA